MHHRLVKIFEDVFDLQLGAHCDDLRREDVPAWDSLSHLRLVLEVEETFDVALEDEEVLQIASLRDFIPALERRERVCKPTG